MSWAAASFSSARDTEFCPPPPQATQGAPGQLACQPLLSPRLAVTVVPAFTTNVVSSGAFPSCDSAGGVTSPTGVRSCTGDTSALGTSTGSYPTTVDGSYHKLAALEGGGGFGQKNGPIEREREAAEEASMGFAGGAPISLEAAATAALSDRRLSGKRIDAGETGTLSSMFDEAEAQEESESDGSAGEGENASPNKVEQDQKRDRGGEGGPTQVLCVPEIATRDTEEYLGIQVRSEKQKHLKLTRSHFCAEGAWVMIEASVGAAETAGARGTPVWGVFRRRRSP